MDKHEAKKLWDATDQDAIVLASEMDADLDGADVSLDQRYADVENSWLAAERVDVALTEGCTNPLAPMAWLRLAYQRRRNRPALLHAAIADKLEAEKSAAARANWKRITIGGADVTEHVAAMYDALVQSTEWGSGFLDAEEIDSILIVGQLAGFSAEHTDDGCPGLESCPGGSDARMSEWRQKRAEQLAAWRAQIEAKARALSGEADAEVGNERFLSEVAAKTGMSHEAIAEAVDAQRKREAAESEED